MDGKKLTYPIYDELTTTKVIVNDLATEQDKHIQFRFPKSKKKRIRNKWAKREGNFKWKKVYSIIKMPGYLVVHSKMFEQLKHNL